MRGFESLTLVSIWRYGWWVAVSALQKHIVEGVLRGESVTNAVYDCTTRHEEDMVIQCGSRIQLDDEVKHVRCYTMRVMKGIMTMCSYCSVPFCGTTLADRFKLIVRVQSRRLLTHNMEQHIRVMKSTKIMRH